MKKFEYFVSYAHQEGFGNALFETNSPITTFDEIINIENIIMEKNIKEVTVLNFQLMREIEEEETN